MCVCIFRFEYVLHQYILYNIIINDLQNFTISFEMRLWAKKLDGIGIGGKIFEIFRERTK